MYLAAWSRGNRWFHRDVLQYASDKTNLLYDFDSANQASRPIVEFLPDLKLFDSGSNFVANITAIDQVTTNAFNQVEGTHSGSLKTNGVFNSDGIELLDKATVVFAKDADPEVRRTIYQVQNVYERSAAVYTTNTYQVCYAGTNVLNINVTANLVKGQYVIGTGIPSGAYVISISTNANIVLSVPVLASGSQTLYINPYLSGVTRAQAGTSLSFTTTTTSPVITGASTTGVQNGQYVTGTGIPANTYVVSFVPNTSVTLSQYPTTAATSTLTFNAMGATTGQVWTVAAGAPIAVESHSPGFAPTISHWGTSVIMDGRFDDDKSYVFVRGMPTAISIAQNVTNAIMSFRLAPSVSNGIASPNLGAREIVNRMQMVLRQMDLFSNGYYLIQLYLNGTTSYTSDSWQSVGGSSLAQYIIHNGGTTISGGEPIFGFYVQSNGSGSYTATQQDLTLVRDMGTSILSGGVSTAAIQVYPDGPDVVTVVATNIGSGSTNIQARMSWTEAQA